MVYNSNEGSLYSPNFMNKLLNRSQVYTYRIEASPGLRLYLSLSYINFGDDMNCSTTSLMIYEGANSNGFPTGQRCGTNSTEFTSTSKIITLKYTIIGNTSLLREDHGFIVYYTSGSQGKDFPLIHLQCVYLKALQHKSNVIFLLPYCVPRRLYFYYLNNFSFFSNK